MCDDVRVMRVRMCDMCSLVARVLIVASDLKPAFKSEAAIKSLGRPGNKAMTYVRV